ncbi:MAG: TraB/GumN family protein [Flavobacteriaceae bacterium]
MRLACTTVLLCLSFVLKAQDRNSLLWEISGNGLEESSYLYGTMHVSKKIAFRLDDVFFEALDKSDIIALESDPDTWLDNEIHQSPDGYGFGYGLDSKGFYRDAFLLESPQIKEIAAYLAFDDRLINNILYRTNEYNQNFEEETYLDMFIYQAGAKYGKNIVALENLEESSTLVARASMNAMKNKPDEWLQKKMQGQDLNYLMQNAYRERNIDLLDSIDRAMYTDYYRKNMLYIRNENMTESLDSVMQNGKVFAGIGAAHLPGSRGVLQLLRDRGYSVLPLVSGSTDKGRQLKQKIEQKVRPTPLKMEFPEDQSFKLLLPNKLYPVAENKTTIYVSPDLANGSYLMVNRIPTYSFLRENSITLNDIERLLFENIPGEIILNKRVMQSGVEGIDIINKLKNGDFQRYQIFVKPLEILIFKMSGEGEYVVKFSDQIFDSLRFKSPGRERVTLQSAYEDFKITMPGEYTFYNPSRLGVRMIEAYQPTSDAYYFLRRASLSDMKYLEEDEFELLQIQKRFYQELGLEFENDTSEDKSQRSQAVFDHEEGRVLYLKAVLNRGDYYLLGALSCQKTEADTFFDSFSLKDEAYPETFNRIRDTAMLFTTISPVKPKKFVENSQGYFRKKAKNKSYNPYTKKTLYQNRNSEAISVEFNKGHDLLAFPNIDSLWSLRKNQYRKKNFQIVAEEIVEKKNNVHQLQFIAADSLSTRGILVKNIVKGGVLYELKAIVDTQETPSQFVSDFFNNFEPLDTLVGKSLVKDKSLEFFDALRDKDSIVYKGYRFPYFDRSHIDSLEFYIDGFEYDLETRHIQSHLIQKLGDLVSEGSWEFFREFYKRSYGNSMAQVKILQSLSKSRSEDASLLLLELMAQDLPLVSNSKEISRIFKPYRKDLESARLLFPELLYYSNVHEYKLEIFSLLADLKSENLIKGNTYKKYVDQLITDARIQLKRHLAREANGQIQRSSQNLSRRNTTALIEDYAILLHPYIKAKEVQQFFARLKEVRSPNIRVTLASLMVSEEEQIPRHLIDSLAGDINSRILLFEQLRANGKTHLFPTLYRVQEALAESAIFEDRNFIASKDEVIYLGAEKLTLQNDVYSGYYFKVRSNQDFDKNYKVYLVVYKSSEEIQTEYFYKNDGYRMSDMDTDQSAMDYLREEFELKDRARAIVFHPEANSSYSQLGY